MITKTLVAATLSVAMISASHASGTVISAVGATVLSGGPGIGDIADTYNGYGLYTDYDYAGGTTNWDAYFAANPLHDFDYVGQEWFSNDGTASAVVSYDLGSVKSIQGMALWTEDAVGIGKLNLLGSQDGATWFNLLSNLSPTNNTNGSPYVADLYKWAATSLRYVKLSMSGCPQTGTPGLLACGIGEVAFNAAPIASNVPELNPSSMWFVGLGLMAIALRRRSI
jgi:hypothetical protein